MKEKLNKISDICLVGVSFLYPFFGMVLYLLAKRNPDILVPNGLKTSFILGYISKAVLFIAVMVFIVFLAAVGSTLGDAAADALKNWVEAARMGG